MNDIKCGFIALIGEPNAGKSTLMNRMVGSKVSIVTHKVQTTRAPIRGITIEENTQLIFIDTPGLFRTQRKLDKAMVSSAWMGAADADIIALLVEAHRGITPGLEMILDNLKNRVTIDQSLVLVINKIDKIKSKALLSLTAELNARIEFEKTFMISAEKGYGVKVLQQWLADHSPQAPWHYPEDQIADIPMRMIAAEITREKLMLRLHQELPYTLTVETEKWEERKDGSVSIYLVVYVTREGHRAIALGPKGQTIKSISMAARKELSKMLERNVHLFIQIRVRPGWENEADRYTNMGLDFRDSK